ncbi:MAG: hypothetical protein ACYCUE_04520 [Steroidobacteraceae bacterium]
MAKPNSSDRESRSARPHALRLLVMSLALSLAAAALGAIASINAGAFYAHLARPVDPKQQ